jgi:Protein N-terminal asparagine amidohydrolase
MIEFPPQVAKALELPSMSYMEVHSSAISPENTEAVYVNDVALTSPSHGARYLGTVNSSDCYTVVLRDPASGETGIIHCNAAMNLAALKWAIDTMQGEQRRPLDVHIVGGLNPGDERLIKAIGEEGMNKNIRRAESILEVIDGTSGLTLRGADILGKKQHEDFGIDTRTGNFIVGEGLRSVVERIALLRDENTQPPPTVIGEPDQDRIRSNPSLGSDFLDKKFIGGEVHLFYDGRENPIPPGQRIALNDQKHRSVRRRHIETERLGGEDRQSVAKRVVRNEGKSTYLG